MKINKIEWKRTAFEGFKFVPQDLWIGAYWKLNPQPWLFDGRLMEVWICFIPMFPLKLVLHQD